MSAILRAKKRKRRPVSTMLLWSVLGIAVAFFILRYGQELLQEHDLLRQAASQRIANAAIRDENARLKAELQYYGSDKYVEQRAREDLNLRRPDEMVLIPVSPAGGATGTSSGGTAAGSRSEASPAPATAQANWRRWLDLFNPPTNSP